MSLVIKKKNTEQVCYSKLKWQVVPKKVVFLSEKNGNV